MNRTSTPWLGLSLILALFLNCTANPCLTCKATLFRGTSASVYLSTHPKPQKVTPEPDGGTTYEWIYTQEEVTPTGGGGGAPRVNPSVVSEILGWLGGGMRDQRIPERSARQETYYFVTLTTDAKGIVKAYSCSSLQLNLNPISRL